VKNHKKSPPWGRWAIN